MADAVTGVIVAAGLSTRMGRPKMLLPIGEGTMLGLVIAAAEASSLDGVIVVTGPGSEDIQAAAGGTRSTWVTNPAPEAGSITSLLAGAMAAPETATMHLLGDTPDLDAATINAVLEAWRAEPALVAVTEYEDGPAHPLILSVDFLAALTQRTGDKVVWSLIEEAPEEAVLRARVPRTRPLDVNTTEEYQAARAEIEASN